MSLLILGTNLANEYYKLFLYYLSFSVSQSPTPPLQILISLNYYPICLRRIYVDFIFFIIISILCKEYLMFAKCIHSSNFLSFLNRKTEALLGIQDVITGKKELATSRLNIATYKGMNTKKWQSLELFCGLWGHQSG